MDEKCKFCNMESGAVIEIEGERRCVLCGHEPESVTREFRKAATLSGFYNCEVCGEEKLDLPGICVECFTPPTEEEIKEWEGS